MARILVFLMKDFVMLSCKTEIVVFMLSQCTWEREIISSFRVEESIRVVIKAYDHCKVVRNSSFR